MFYVTYQILMVSAMVVSVFLLVLALRRRHDPNAISLALLAVCIFIWIFGYYLESLATSLERQLFYTAIGYVGNMIVPVAWFLFAFGFTRDIINPVNRRTIWLFVLPAVFIALVWTNQWHSWMWSNARLVETGRFLVTVKDYNAGFWVAIAYSYLLVLAGSFLLLRNLKMDRQILHTRSLLLIIAVLVPFLWNIIYVFRIEPLSQKDLTPAMFAVSGILIALGVLKYRLFDIIPFSSEFIIRNLEDSIIMQDAAGRIVNANPAAYRLLGIKPQHLGDRIDKHSHLPEQLAELLQGQEDSLHVYISVNGEKRLLDARKIPLGEPERRQGYMIICKDITQQQAMVEKLRQSEANLRVTMNELPIGIRIVDASDQELYVNQAFLDIFGYGSADDLKEHPVIAQYSEKDRVLYQSFREKRLRGETGTFNYEIEITRRDGQKRRVELFQRTVLWKGEKQ